MVSLVVLTVGESTPVLNVNQTLRVRVAEVGFVREAEVDLRLIERVFDLVRIYAGGEAGNDFLYFELMRGVQDVVVDEDVVPQEVELPGPSLINERDWRA